MDRSATMHANYQPRLVTARASQDAGGSPAGPSVASRHRRRPPASPISMPDKTSLDRRRFVRGISFAAMNATVVAAEAQTIPAWAGVVLQANEGQLIPPTPDGRKITVKIDSHATPGVRMSMIVEDLPPKAEIRVHLHRNEDETIFIRMRSGIATLVDRESGHGRRDHLRSAGRMARAAQ
jgi:hypothetical protein